MFRKAQLKLFSVITSILLAVFIGLLGAVNIITREVMSRQSEYVLEQIAAGIEYDDNTNKFNMKRPVGAEPRKFDIWKETPPEKPSDENSGTEETTVVSSTTTATSTEAVTEAENISEPEPLTEAVFGKVSLEEAYVPEEDNAVNETLPVPQTQAPHTETPQPSDQDDDDDDDDDDERSERQKRRKEKKERRSDQWSAEDQPYTHWWENRSDENKKSDDDDDDDEKIVRSSFYDTSSGGIMLLANTSTSAVTTSMPVNTSETSAIPQPPHEDIPPEERMNGRHFENIPKSIGSIEFFAVMADQKGGYKAVLNNDELSEDTAQKYITEILSKKSDNGMLGNLQFCRMSKHNGTLIVFTDKSGEIDMLKNLKHITIVIGLISIIILSIAAYFLSKKSIEPIKIAFERQKQFVSDASHELKTPLTVISANADVLEGEIGENKWLSYIRSQTDRMSVLVNDLLNLTRLENSSKDFITTDFDLSKAIENTALPFECQAFEQNKKFIIDVDKGITINGSEKHIKQMAAIFIDNALKYSNDGGTVKVTLKHQGDKKVFSVYNTGQGIKNEDKERIFERFYRSDESRNRATGGYGLGLAIAKSIIDKHKFKINVINQEGKDICFVITM